MVKESKHGSKKVPRRNDLRSRRKRGTAVAKILVEQALAKAKSHTKKGEVAEARSLYATILKAFPNNKKAQQGLTALGGDQRYSAEHVPSQAVIDQLISLYRQGRLEVVVGQAKDLTAQFPKAITLWSILGASSAQIGKLEQALIAFKNVIAIKPNDPKPHNNIGNILKDLGKLEEAVKAYNKAVSLKPDYAEAYLNMGNALHDQSKLVEAVKAYNKAISLKPNYSQAYLNMGNALSAQGKLEDALEAFNKALSFKPDYAEVYYNMGIALADQGKLEEAIEAYNKALFIKPDYAEVCYNMGIALADQGKLEEAIEAYNKALAIKPDYAEAYNNMGVTLQDHGKLVESMEAYNKALDINPDYESARVQTLHQKAHICDWNSMTADRTLIPELGTTNKHVDPFSLLSLEDSPERHQIRSKIYSAAKFPQKLLPGQVKPSQKHKRIRLGYFSSDLKEHPVAYLMAKMLEQHDRDQFEVFGYSLHGNQQSDMRQRLLQSFDRFTDVRSMTDKTVALQARQDGIDIAIDLNGYTEHGRTGIFAYRAAPIQINYLGYPGTLGADFMDYIVADKFLIPEANQKYFNEQPLYLPHTYMPTDDTRELSQKPISRKDVGLPNDAFVFCCFNNNYKISSAEFDIWMRLLNKVEGSVLWLRKSNEISHLNMKKEAQKRDIDPSRLVFADRAPMDEHLARQRLADLFVDTFAFNAHTTATEALWAGLPVVTKAGQGFAARVAGSLLNAIGLPELVTTIEQDYEELILELATNPTKLAQVKDKLATNRLTQPLFNTELYTKHLENGYHQAYQNYFDGNPPQTITVPR